MGEDEGEGGFSHFVIDTKITPICHPCEHEDPESLFFTKKGKKQRHWIPD